MIKIGRKHILKVAFLFEENLQVQVLGNGSIQTIQCWLKQRWVFKVQRIQGFLWRTLSAKILVIFFLPKMLFFFRYLITVRTIVTVFGAAHNQQEAHRMPLHNLVVPEEHAGSTLQLLGSFPKPEKRIINKGLLILHITLF